MASSQEKYWKLGILGYPLGYSLSPLIQERALKEAGLRGEYREYSVGPDEIWDWLNHLSDLGLDGFNVTMPYKRSIFAWLVSSGEFGRSDRDGPIGAINTIVMKDGHPIGYNTDGEGFLKSLMDPPRCMNLTGWDVVLLGAGGAAQAIAVTLALDTKIRRITIWNRDPVRAKALVSQVNVLRRSEDFGKAVEELSAVPIRTAQLVVNATPIGMDPGDILLVKPEDLTGRQVVYDIVYKPRETELIRTARSKECPVVTGDEMLAGQGAAAFELWTGKKGMLPVMRQALNDYSASRG